MICGVDRATGANAATATEQMNEIHIEDSVDENDMEGVEPKSKKRKEKTSAVDIIDDVVSAITRNMEHDSSVTSQPPPPPPPISRADRIYAAIAAIADLNETEVIQAIDMLSDDDKKADVFMALSMSIRRTWLRLHLRD
ncbi:hypothetical protein KSP40_PGU017378 [Platanthera guangdongensis]|uniref:Uncharacterized protein n=1 Tax=Platanthera guangdongensis TaxID=2320717 RepID=A0ABR2M2G5_9ASPA